jgi:hypothetical protein
LDDQDIHGGTGANRSVSLVAGLEMPISDGGLENYLGLRRIGPFCPARQRAESDAAGPPPLSRDA